MSPRLLSVRAIDLSREEEKMENEEEQEKNPNIVKPRYVKPEKCVCVCYLIILAHMKTCLFVS